MTARTAALAALMKMERRDGYSNIVLDSQLEAAGLSPRDRALASALFYGVLERRLTLDYYISRCLRDPGRRLDPAAQEALRCGAYQILYMDRVPDSAAVNETVNALKDIGKGKLAGFVNGVLRGLVRKKGEIRLPGGNTARALSLRYSVPEGLVRLWKRSYGDAITEEILEGFMEKPRLYVRVNLAKTSGPELQASLQADGLDLELLDAPRGAAALAGCGNPAELRQFREGLFHVQDLSAQWACALLDPQPGETVWDCCAAPGGKSFTLSQALGEGKLYASDLHPARVRLIEEGAARLGLRNVEALVGDATQDVEIPLVDKIFCDAPCSGFGVMRRKPEIRYKDLREAEALPALQSAILQKAAEKLKPGGVLAYATCTLNPAENREVAEKFLAENNGFEPMHIETGVKRMIDEPGYMLTMLPAGGASDGFFAARFRKKQE